jgi:signal peptidase I
MLRLLKVSGDSLHPTYRDGDFVLASKIPYLFGAVQRGDVVVFRHQVYGTMIKMIDSITPDTGEIRVVGIHDHSVDSREFGTIRRRDILGKVIWHIKKQSDAQPINEQKDAAKKRRSRKKHGRRNPT